MEPTLIDENTNEVLNFSFLQPSSPFQLSDASSPYSGGIEFVEVFTVRL